MPMMATGDNQDSYFLSFQAPCYIDIEGVKNLWPLVVVYRLEDFYKDKTYRSGTLSQF